MPKKKKAEPRYLIYCGDAEYRFAFGKLYRQSYVHQIFRQRLKLFADNFLPGLVLRDGSGQLWKPVVRVELVPIKSED